MNGIRVQAKQPKLMTPKFSKGDRVKVSAEGLARLQSYHSYQNDPERVGTIERANRTHTGFHVLWDGRKCPDCLHGDYLELATTSA